MCAKTTTVHDCLPFLKSNYTKFNVQFPIYSVIDLMTFVGMS